MSENWASRESLPNTEETESSGPGCRHVAAARHGSCRDINPYATRRAACAEISTAIGRPQQKKNKYKKGVREKVFIRAGLQAGEDYRKVFAPSSETTIFSNSRM